MVKNSIFFEFFGPPCRNALANLDGSIPKCAQVCPLHIEPHLEALRKIEMVAVLCTNETTPIFFRDLTPPPPAPRGRWTPEREVALRQTLSYTNKICCGSVHALLRYCSKTTEMQKFPIDSYSNESFISPFCRPRGAANPQNGRRHTRNVIWKHNRYINTINKL